MPTVITATANGLVIQNPNADANTGRWCKSPLVPNLCYTCFDPKTLASLAATGYREDADGWRYGMCEHCSPRGDNQRKD